MYFKPLVNILAFVLGAIGVAAQITPGTYQILNVGANATAQSTAPGGAVFVSNIEILPFPPPSFWSIATADQGGFTIENVRLSAYAGAQPQGGEVVRVLESPMTFSITPAGNQEVQIGTVNEDLLWTVAPGSTFPANVTLDPANGDAGQRWVLIAQSSA